MDTSRVILHCDLNNFFAAVACLLNPELRGKPVAVCGNPKLRKGIVLAKSEIAKQCGVKTGMAIWQARQLCPDLIVVPPNYHAYTRYSQQVQQIYYRFTNQVESFGIDECWLDVTGSQKLFGDGVTIAHQIRTAVKHEVGLTISVGVAFNKTYAKLGSDLAAPDAVTVINAENYQQLIYPLPLESLLFVGKKTRLALNKLNLRTIGDLARSDLAVLRPILGVNADKLVAAARGAENNPVADFDRHTPPKSVGNGTTTPMDLTTVAQVEQVVYLLCEKVAYRLRRYHLQGYTVSLAVKGADLSWVSAQHSLTIPTNTVPTMRQAAMAIFVKIWPGNSAGLPPVRALRVAVSHLVTQVAVQTNFLGDADTEHKQRVLAQVFDTVRAKYGSEHIMLGGTPQSYQQLGVHIEINDDDR